MRILNNILNPHDPLSIIINILNILPHHVLNHKLSGLISIMLDKIIQNKFIQIEKMSALVKSYS